MIISETDAEKKKLLRIKIVILSVLIVIVSMVFTYSNLNKVFVNNISTKTDFRSTPVNWSESILNNGVVRYELYDKNKPKDTRLLFTCREGRLTVDDLKVLTALRVLENGANVELFYIGLTGENVRVPIVRNANSTAKEDIDFINKLVSSNLLSFDVNGIKHVWSVNNKLAPNDCTNYLSKGMK